MKSIIVQVCNNNPAFMLWYVWKSKRYFLFWYFSICGYLVCFILFLRGG